MKGTLVNTATVMVGSSLGVVIGSRLSFLLRSEALKEMIATGGLIIPAIGICLLAVKRMKIENLLPAFGWW